MKRRKRAASAGEDSSTSSSSSRLLLLTRSRSRSRRRQVVPSAMPLLLLLLLLITLLPAAPARAAAAPSAPPSPPPRRAPVAAAATRAPLPSPCRSNAPPTQDVCDADCQRETRAALLEIDRLTRTAATPGWTPQAARANRKPLPPSSCAGDDKNTTATAAPDYCCWSPSRVRCCCAPGGCSTPNCSRCPRVGGVYALRLDAAALEAPFSALVPALSRLVRFGGLRHVALMTNNLTGTIPAGAIADLKGLETLDLGSNG